MLSLVSRALCRRWRSVRQLPLPPSQQQSRHKSVGSLRRLQLRREYEIKLDFSWVSRDASGRPLPPPYLTDHTKSPDEILAGLTEFDRQRMRDIEEQIDIQAALGKTRVPDRAKMTSFDWIHLLSCTSLGTLGNKLFYVATKQLSIEKELEQKAEKAQIRQAQASEKEDRPNTFDCIHPRIERAELKAFYDLRLTHEYQYCPSLVFDMSFHDCMTSKAFSDLGSQLKHIFHANREYSEPFQLHFCNLRRDTQQYYFLHKLLGAVDYDATNRVVGNSGRIAHSFEDMWPYSFTDACYSSLFPQQDLVYMSPNGKQEMQEYDPTKVYIIGGLVDLGGHEVGITRSKAAGQGIRSLRLPRAVCSRSLPLNIFVELMQTMRLTGSWLEAKSHLPRRMQLQLQQQPRPPRDDIEKTLLHGTAPAGPGWRPPTERPMR